MMRCAPRTPRLRGLFRSVSVPLWVALLGIAAQAADRSADPPNIIIILADDLGWSDVGFNGCREIPTPHLDALAKSGARLTCGYASHSYCSPSRAGLLTGRHQQRFGHEGNPVKRADGLPLTETLLPAVLKQRGYRTAAVGKWHLGDEEAYLPHQRGFDEWFGFSGGSMDYWGKDGPAGSGIVRNGQPVPKSELTHLTEDFSREAVGFIERNRERPFFLYLAYNAPHSPNQVTQAQLRRTEHIEQPGRAIYGAMIAAMDAGIGDVLGKLNELKLTERTLIFFFSDNGGRADGAQNFPFRGHKGMLLEGGIRVPFCVAWPGRIPSGQTIDTPITALDIFPTALAAAGQAAPEGRILDGADLLPHLIDAKQPLPPRTLVWRYALGKDEFGYAVRDGEYKLVSVHDKRKLLFKIESDPYERRDLAAAQPEIVERLTAKYNTWAQAMKPPLWLDPHGANIRGEESGHQRAFERATAGERPE